jgi:hypothetical protein
MGDKVDLLQLKARLEKLGVHIDAPASTNASHKRDKPGPRLQVGMQVHCNLAATAAAPLSCNCSSVDAAQCVLWICQSRVQILRGSPILTGVLRSSTAGAVPSQLCKQHDSRAVHDTLC